MSKENKELAKSRKRRVEGNKEPSQAKRRKVEGNKVPQTKSRKVEKKNMSNQAKSRSSKVSSQQDKKKAGNENGFFDKKRRVIFGIIAGLILLLVITALVIATNREPVEEEPEVELVIEEIEEEEEEEEEEVEEVFVPGGINPLTGLADMADEAAGKRPVAIVVGNVGGGLPQEGIAAADIIYEFPVEGGLTRLLAIYADYTQIPEVASVRSLRIYFPLFSQGYDAIIVHSGMDPSIPDRLAELNVDRLDHGVNDGGLINRCQSRINAGFSSEHTAYFDGPRAPEVFEEMGLRTELVENMRGFAFRFPEPGEEVVPDGAAANFVNVSFSANFSRFIFDPERNVYLKENNGAPHMDASTDEQLAFTNLFILESEMYMRTDVHWEVEWIGGPNHRAYFVSNGMVQEVTWQRDDLSERGRLRFFDRNGEEIVVNRGKTYIAIYREGAVSFE